MIGSQAILGSFPQAPPEALVSIEADVFPRERPDLADNVDGAIGEGSMFHETFGYYAHGVGPETPIAPAGWMDRLVPLANENTRGATGWCMEPHDLVLAKLAAGREKDVEFARALLQHGLVDAHLLVERLAQLPVREPQRVAIRQLIDALGA